MSLTERRLGLRHVLLEQQGRAVDRASGRRTRRRAGCRRGSRPLAGRSARGSRERPVRPRECCPVRLPARGDAQQTFQTDAGSTLLQLDERLDRGARVLREQLAGPHELPFECLIIGRGWRSEPAASAPRPAGRRGPSSEVHDHGSRHQHCSAVNGHPPSGIEAPDYNAPPDWNSTSHRVRFGAQVSSSARTARPPGTLRLPVEPPGQPPGTPKMGRIFEARKHTMFARWDRMAKQFARIGKEIAIAVKAGGPNPDANPACGASSRTRAPSTCRRTRSRRRSSAPRARTRTSYEEILYEGYAPHGIAVLVETATDNPTRTVANVRTHFNKGGGNLAQHRQRRLPVQAHGRLPPRPRGHRPGGARARAHRPRPRGDGRDAPARRASRSSCIRCAFADFGQLQKALEDRGITPLSAESEYVPTDAGRAARGRRPPRCSSCRPPRAGRRRAEGLPQPGVAFASPASRSPGIAMRATLRIASWTDFAIPTDGNEESMSHSARRWSLFVSRAALVLAAAALHAAPVTQRMRIDNFGYRPGDVKVAVVIAEPRHHGADPQPRRPRWWPRPHRRRLDHVPWADGASSGDSVWWVDFCAFSTPGSYRLYSSALGGQSYDFEIRADVYDARGARGARARSTSSAATRRSSAAHAGAWADPPPATLGDAATGPAAGPHQPRLARPAPAAGTTPATTTSTPGARRRGACCSCCAPTRTTPGVFVDGDLDIPESGNGVPDLLDEVKWELDWLLKMQLADGSVLYQMHVPASTPTRRPRPTQRRASTRTRRSSRERCSRARWRWRRGSTAPPA